MAQIKINFPDAVTDRICMAFSQTGQPATLQDIEAALKKIIQLRVAQHEADLDASAKLTSVRKENW